jgi:hypothetical protein
MTTTEPKSGDATNRMNALVRLPRVNTIGPWKSLDKKPKCIGRSFCPDCNGWGDRTIFRIKCKACGGTGWKPNDNGDSEPKQPKEIK